jgi:hypothetical protein
MELANQTCDRSQADSGVTMPVEVRGLDLFHSRFVVDPRWNPASLAIDDQFSNELERLEETYATRPGFMERASHLLLMARRRKAAVHSKLDPIFAMRS